MLFAGRIPAILENGNGDSGKLGKLDSELVSFPWLTQKASTEEALSVPIIRMSDFGIKSGTKAAVILPARISFYLELSGQTHYTDL